MPHPLNRVSQIDYIKIAAELKRHCVIIDDKTIAFEEGWSDLKIAEMTGPLVRTINVVNLRHDLFPDRVLPNEQAFAQDGGKRGRAFDVLGDKLDKLIAAVEANTAAILGRDQ